MKGILRAAKNIPIHHNVSLRVLDAASRKVVSEHTGHNAATNSLLTGIGHYLSGNGILNQGAEMLSAYIPKYISLGTMGLMNQDSREDGTPDGIGVISYKGKKYDELSDGDMETLGHMIKVIDDEGLTTYELNPPDFDTSKEVTDEDDEMLRYIDYMTQTPGFGADGHDDEANNNRAYLGLGPVYGSIIENAAGENILVTNNCELISDSFPRAKISFRDVVPESEAEYPQTIDVVFSAMVSTGALKQFRGDKDYVFITEAGLWSTPTYSDGGDNGLLAGYRIGPTEQSDWNMKDAKCRDKLRRQIIKVGINQVVQVIWKIQLGSIDQFGGIETLYPNEFEYRMKWVNWF